MITFLQRRIAFAILALCCTGCGTKTYEERLANTAAFYNFLTNVDANLEQPWKSPESGMTLRVPKPFRNPLPPPVVHKDQLETERAEPDTRLKNPLNLEIEGLVAVWTGNLVSQDDEPDTWIYILANHQRKANVSDTALKPNTFLVDLEHQLMAAFGITIADGETSKKGINSRYKCQFPDPISEAAKYNAPINYSMIDFVAEGLVNGKNLSATLAERRLGGDTQVALLAIYPQNVPNQFRQRLEMSLATWDAKPWTPSRSAPSRGPGGAGPTKRTAF